MIYDCIETISDIQSLILNELPVSFRYNKLLAVISKSLRDIIKALKGLVVMSSELELMANSLYNNVVPDMWKAKVGNT